MAGRWLTTVVVMACCGSGVGWAQTEEPVYDPFPLGVVVAEQARASFTLLGAGARAMGMGGAFTAVADDATAASFNPAGLTQLTEPEASVVFSQVDLRDSYTDFRTTAELIPLRLTDAVVDFSSDNVTFASLTVPFRAFDRRWAVQVSQQRVVDFTYEGVVAFDELTPDGTLVANIGQGAAQEGDITIQTASIALEATERMLLGISLNRWDGDWAFISQNRRFSESLSIPRALDYAQQTKFDGLNVDLGLLLRYPKVKVGLRYRSSFEADTTVFTLFGTNYPEFDVSDDTFAPFRTDLNWPSALNVGISIRPTDRWQIAADWGRTKWSELSYEVDAFDVSFFDLTPTFDSTTEDTEDWRVGTELLVFAGDTVIPLRAGWFREPQPARDVVTGEQIVYEGVAAGVGVKRGSIAVDLAVRYMKLDDVRVSRFFAPSHLAPTPDDLVPNSVGNLSRERYEILLSMIIQAPRSSRLGKVLHEIFVGPVDAAD